MELILVAVLFFLVGFLTAGYLHYRRCRRAGMSRAKAIAAMVGGGGNPHEPL